MKRLLGLLLGIFFALFLADDTWAREMVLGVHVLDIEEIDQAKVFSPTDEQEWGFITVPLRLDQLDKARWQRFMDKANEHRLIPIVRLMTEFDAEGGYWRIPTREEIIRQATFLSSLNWHSEPRRVIVFNEPNHAAEWGGLLDPASYAEILVFTADWLHTERADYLVLPAGLDAAAPNGKTTMDSFSYLEAMVKAEPSVLDKIDAWTSHSYPNPGFSASAYRTGKNTIEGWEYELNLLKQKWNKEYEVYITETGWDQSKISDSQLEKYYKHAMEVVWNDSRIAGVTPFVLNGNNGIFNGFSLLTADGQPTQQMKALLTAWSGLQEKSDL